MAHADTDYAQPGHRRFGCLLLILNKAGDVLLVRPSYRDGWILPGGGALPDEAPHLAALREGAEETGLSDLAVGSLLIADYIRASGDGSAAEGINFVFDGGTVEDDTTITLPAPRPGQQPELTAWAFVPPGQLADYCLPYQLRRITQALTALADPAQRGYRVRGRHI
ncbi:NUDIX domain-containing protein [Streptomyces sp. NPDC002680]|uniref:NUDIX domain-containing protein n=1 Tax=Streptomyces sp. NPDC002680 TaxID=3364659 RepID=UPI003674BFBF